jgi:hypothetical protein
MTVPNMTLYRLLVKFGASEAEAEMAAQLDTTQLVTKADLKAEVSELKADLLKWTIGIVVSVAGIQAALIIFAVSLLLRGK